MIIHTSLTEDDVRAAGTLAGITFARLAMRGSRKRDHAFDVILSGSGAHRSQYREQDYPAATWDEWGIFLAWIFRRDESADATYYKGADDFHWQTGDRFRTLTPSRQHKLHKWSFVSRAATGTYSVRECKCGAVNRWRTAS